MERQKQLLPIIIVIALSVVLRVPFLKVPMISDEGGYAYVAHFWSADYMPYRDVPFDRPQGLFLLYRLALEMGEGIGAIRLFAALWNALTTATVLLCCHALFRGERRAGAAALLGAGLFALFSTAPRIEGFTANAEIFTLLPLTVAALFTWRRQWLLAGLAAGIATAIKPNGAAGLALAIGWLLVVRARPRDLLRLLGGFAVAPGLCVLHGALLDWAAYWDSFVGRRLLLYSATSMGVGEQLDHLIDGFGDTASAWAALAAATAYAAFRLRDRASAFIGLWVLSSLAGMALGGLWHWHYFQQLIPPLAVGAGGALIAADRRVSGRARIVDAVFGFAALAGLALFARADAPFWFREPNDISRRIYDRPAYVFADDIGRYIRRHTRPDDRIQVAFAEAQIYYAARRKAAVPQLYWRDVQYSAEIFHEVISAIETGRPAIIVKSQNPPGERMHPQDFVDLLSRNYRLVNRAGALEIWVKRR